MASQNDNDVSPTAQKLSAVVPSMSASTQERSHLVNLPAELRFMILEDLLIYHGILKYRSEYRKPKNIKLPPKPVVAKPAKKPSKRKSLPRSAKDRQSYLEQLLDSEEEQEVIPPKPVVPTVEKVRWVKGYGLTPAILRVCQALWREGLQLLYGENVLYLTLDDHVNSGNRREARLSSPVWRKDAFIFESPAGSLQWQVGAKDFLSRFTKFELESRAKWRYHMSYVKVQRQTLILLNEAVKESSVTARIVGWKHSGDKRSGDDDARMFSLLRCRSLKLDGIKDENLVNEILDAAKEDDQLKDLCEEWEELDPIFQFFPMSHNVRTWRQERETQLREAVYLLDRKKFDTLRSEVFAELDRRISKIRAASYRLEPAQGEEKEGKGIDA